MKTYRICDLTLESNMALDVLPVASGRSAQFSFRFEGKGAPLTLEPRRMVRSQTRNGQVLMDVGDLDGERLLRFPGVGDFRFSANGRSVVGCSRNDVALGTIRQLFLDQVLPLILSSQSDLVLNAAAVETEHGAAAFVGDTESGKSTLIAKLACAGHALISDDFLLLRAHPKRWLAHPSYPGLHLWPDSAEALFGSDEEGAMAAGEMPKRRCGTDGRLPFAIEPNVLERVYVLAPPTSDRVVITRLSTREAFAEMVEHCYRLEIDDRQFLGRQFGALTRLADRPIFRRLAFPRTYSMLSETRRAIRSDLDLRSIRS